MKPRVLIHSQSLLGIGHERRTHLIANALQSQGLDTHLALGGPSAIKNTTLASIHHLPSLRAADAAFIDLLDADGNPADDAYKSRRQQALESLFDHLNPDALILELFPFGRRMLRFELLPLLEQAASRDCRVFCSLRDILVTKQGEKAARKRAWAIDLVKRHFGRVLLHGDPSFVPLEASFPDSAELGEKLTYTGLVAPPPPPSTADRRGVLVSVGGGAVGAELLFTAQEAARQTASVDNPWTLVAGPHSPDAVFEKLNGVDHPHITVIRSHPDLVSLMARSEVSISQAGYNTVCDALATRTPSVLVPFSTETETEQQTRADRLAHFSPFTVLATAGATASDMCTAVESVRGSIDWPTIDLDGAEKTARLVAKSLAV